MTVPCEGQLLLLTPPFEDSPLEPIVLGSVPAYPGLVDEYGTQVCTQASSMSLVLARTLKSSRSLYCCRHLAKDTFSNASCVNGLSSALWSADGT